MKRNDSHPTEAQAPPRPGAALVVDRWNSWARLWFPENDETAWVNLAEVGFQRVPAAGPATPRDDG